MATELLVNLNQQEAIQNETQEEKLPKSNTVSENCRITGQPNTHVIGVPKERRWQGRRKEMKKY